MKYGFDACGATLFCAALDGRTIPTCYLEKSRLDGQECTENRQCASGSCNIAESKCAASPWATCSATIGCASPGVDGNRYVCDTRLKPPECRSVSQNNVPGSVCLENTDCDTRRCVDHVCLCREGMTMCGGKCVSKFSTNSCGSSCSVCPDPWGATPTCDGSRCGFTCDSGYTLCNGSCVSCPSNALSSRCEGSTCVASSCAVGSVLCGGVCEECVFDSKATARGCSLNQCVSTACVSGYSVQSGKCVRNTESIFSAFEDHKGMPLDLELDSRNQPHVVFVVEDQLHYAWRDSIWHPEVIPSSDVLYPSLAVDAQNHPHVTYHSNTSLLYSTRTSEGWSHRAEDVLDASYPGNKSHLMIDSNGRRHVAYQSGYFPALNYAWRDATDVGTWNHRNLYNPDERFNPFAFLGLGFNAFSTPIVLYLLPGTVQVASQNGNMSQVLEIPSPPDTDTRTDLRSMVIDGAGTIHIAYDNGADTLIYARYSDNRWESQVVGRIFDRQRIGLALNASGVPYIAYALGGIPMIVSRSNGVWQTEKVYDEHLLECYNVDLEIDSLGARHVVYGTKRYGLRYVVLR